MGQNITDVLNVAKLLCCALNGGFTKYFILKKCYEYGTVSDCYSVVSRYQIIYPGEKPHKCNVCGKGFTQRSQVRDYTGERSFRCNGHDRTFSLTSSIRQQEENLLFC